VSILLPLETAGRELDSDGDQKDDKETDNNVKKKTDENNLVENMEQEKF